MGSTTASPSKPCVKHSARPSNANWESTVSMSDLQKVATLDEIPPGGRKSLVFDDRAVLLLRVGEEFFAVEDVCSHDGQPLTDGPLEERRSNARVTGRGLTSGRGAPCACPPSSRSR